MLRYLIAGESHGRGMVAVIEGMPAGLNIDEGCINKELRRRQMGFGRGKRMKIEKDKAQVLSGTKNNVTLASPISLLIINKDYRIENIEKVMCPRPGHADLPGLLKYGMTDIREVLERASARSTAGIVAVGAVCKILLSVFKITVTSSVLSVGGENKSALIRGKIQEAIDKKDTVGGVFEVSARGVPVGLGSYVQPDRRLDGRLAQAVMSIPGIKAVEIGLGLGYAVSFGSEVHDEIYHDRKSGYVRKTNNAGGIEGGISNGEDIIIRGCMKPIATLMSPLASVDIRTKRGARAAIERSDVCVVEAAGVVAESAVAFELAKALLEKFGNDSLGDMRRAYADYIKRLK